MPERLPYAAAEGHRGVRMGTTADKRQRQVAAWLTRQGLDPAGLTPLAADAGTRRYFRLATPDGPRVIMDAPEQPLACQAYLRIGGLLGTAGVHVPAVTAADPDAGVMVLEDLGDNSYLDALAGATATADALMEAALEALVRLQAATRPDVLPVYDAARLQAELALFPAWYVRRHLGVQPDSAWMAAWQRSCRLLVAAALEQPRVWVHRDFMARNLLVATPNPGVIDFQDALLGPVTYDLVSLLRDAFIDFPPAAEARWCARYAEYAQDAGIALPAQLAAAVDWMGVQRHLKVLGIFARLRYRDGKPRYLADAPRFLAYLERELAPYPALAELRELLAALPRPESAQ